MKGHINCITLVLLCICQGIAFGQNKAEINVEIGYFSPYKESFRKNYDQTMFVSTAKVPLSAGIGIRYFVTPNTCLHIHVQRTNSTLKANDNMTFAVTPLAIGVQQYISHRLIGSEQTRFYVGSDIGYYWARFSGEMLRTPEYGPEPQGLKKISMNYYGFGIMLHAGFDHMINNSFLFGLELAFDSNHLGRVDEGGLGNIGGLQLSGKFAWRF